MQYFMRLEVLPYIAFQFKHVFFLSLLSLVVAIQRNAWHLSLNVRHNTEDRSSYHMDTRQNQTPNNIPPGRPEFVRRLVFDLRGNFASPRPKPGRKRTRRRPIYASQARRRRSQSQARPSLVTMPCGAGCSVGLGGGWGPQAQLREGCMSNSCTAPVHARHPLTTDAEILADRKRRRWDGPGSCWSALTHPAGLLTGSIGTGGRSRAIWSRISGYPILRIFSCPAGVVI